MAYRRIDERGAIRITGSRGIPSILIQNILIYVLLPTGYTKLNQLLLNNCVPAEIPPLLGSVVRVVLGDGG